MFRQKFVFEVKGAEDRIHSLMIDPSAPLGEIYDALTVIRKHVFDQIQQQENKDIPKENLEKQSDPEIEE